MGRWGASFQPAHLGLVALSIRLFASQTYGVYIDRRSWLVNPQVPATLNADWGGGVGWGEGGSVPPCGRRGTRAHEMAGSTHAVVRCKSIQIGHHAAAEGEEKHNLKLKPARHCRKRKDGTGNPCVDGVVPVQTLYAMSRMQRTQGSPPFQHPARHTGLLVNPTIALLSTASHCLADPLTPPSHTHTTTTRTHKQKTPASRVSTKRRRSSAAGVRRRGA
jgi:hypothetical protein